MNHCSFSLAIHFSILPALSKYAFSRHYIQLMDLFSSHHGGKIARFFFVSAWFSVLMRKSHSYSFRLLTWPIRPGVLWPINGKIRAKDQVD
jgi:hypothetical protein